MSTEDKQEDFDLAIFNLDGVTDPSDLKKCALQIQSYLKLCGDTSLEKIQSSADVTTVANIFALTGSVLDLILYSVSPKQDDDGVKQVALLAINLIGLFPDPQNEAFTRVALRPMLGLMAECLYKKKGKIRQSDIKRMQLHLNHQIAGDLGKFIDETQGRIGELLASAATLAVQILQSIANPTFGIAIGVASSGASADTRDPDQQFTNWAKPLSELAATSTFVPISINPLQISRLQLEASEAISSVTSVINAQSSGDKYSIAWLIAETKKVLAGMKNKGTANVPINQTGEYERETNGQTLEFVSLQADALLEPPCPDSETNSTSNRISFSMGTEKVSHSDFYIPEIDFTYNRLYSSQLLELDQSVVGSRWMMPFSNIIKKQDEHYVYIDGRARTHYVPKSILKKAYEIPYEGIKITAVEGDILCIDSGDGWKSYYLRQESLEDFYPYAFLNEKNNNEIKLYYQNLYQKIYLQQIEFNIKNKKCTLKFAYNDLGKVIAVFKGEEVKPLSEYVYSAQGDLIQAVDQNGHIRNYEYNAYHQLTRYTDRTGRGQNIRYESINAKARAIEEWADDDYFHTRLEWHKKLRQVAIFNAENLPTYYYYDLFGFTYRIRLADGREQWTYRDNKKRIIKQIDFFGRETNQEYNDQDQLSKVNLPNGGVIRFAYDENGNLSETKDPEGNIWKQEYDDQGNMVKQINPLGHTQQYKYNSDHQVVMITDSKGGQKQVQYNDLGQMIAFKDCSGKLSQWKYDELGRLIEEISAEDQKVHYQYSEAGVDKGYLKTITYSDGLKEQFDRDQEGRLLRHVGTKGDITQYQYDKTGLLQHRIDPNRHQISYHWNKLGQLIRLTNQNQADYLFDYDEYGQLIREKAFDGEEKYYAYNENGLLSEIRQANIVTTLDYGADTKLVYRQLKHSQSGVSQEEYFHYNLNGNLNQVSNADSQNDWYYNALGQVEREHQQYKLPNQKPMVAIIRYRYDELGNLINTIRPDKQEIDWLNYGSGHVYAIALNQQDIIGFKRDNLHRETERYLISGLIEKKYYNDVGLLSSQHIFSDDDASYIQYQADRHYQYDQNYFLTQVKDSRLGTYEYKYDPIGRLIKAQNKNMKETYLFDPAGNLLDPDDYLEQHLKNNTLKAFLGAHYHYDEQGNVREKQTINNVLKLNWDNSNRLIASEQNGQKTKYAYDVFGRRIYKQTENEGLTLFGWDGDQMIWESYASDQPLKKTSYTKHYIYEPNSFIPVAQAGYNEFIELVELPNYAEKFKDKEYSTRQDPIWQSDLFKRKKHAESLVFYHVDQIGTPQVLTNDQGEKVWDIKLDTWGKALEINTSNNLLEQTNIRFQGQYYDEETGLYYNRHRYYEPHSARYVSKDPIGLMGGLNNQTYVKDPNGWVDPMGLIGDATQKLIEKKIVPHNVTKAELSKDLGNLGTTADVASVACLAACQPAVPFLKAGGTTLGIVSTLLDDSKSVSQKIAGIFLPSKVAGKAEKFVGNTPGVNQVVASAYALMVDKTTGAAIDATYEQYGQKKSNSSNTQYKINPNEVPIIPKDPLNFQIPR